MPRSEEQFQAMRDESRERLMEAALALFARDGYARTSVRTIAREAGVSQGLMYNYFASKEELLREIYERGMRDVEASFAEIRDAGTPAARLSALIRSSIGIVRRNAPFWRLLYGIRFQAGVLEGLDDGIARWSARIGAELEGLLREIGVADPAAEAQVLFALIDGMAQHALLDPEHFPLERAITVVEARYGAPGR